MISIIVPVYRVEEYLCRCLDSVLAQTCTDWECILVDDGSPDRSGAICDAYAERDSRFAVIHQKNGGLSVARNAGVRVARGDWFFFLDSDDWLHPRTLELLLLAADGMSADIALCGFQTASEWAEPAPCHAPAVSLLTPREAAEKIYGGGVRYVVTWAKLYRCTVIEGIPFPKGHIHEDEATTYRFYHRAAAIAEVEAPLYYYYQNAAGITGSAYSLKRLDALTALEERAEFYRSEGDAPLLTLTLTAYVGNAIRQLAAIRRELGDPETADGVERRVVDFIAGIGGRISHADRLRLAGITHGNRLRFARWRDEIEGEGFGGFLAERFCKLLHIKRRNNS